MSSTFDLGWFLLVLFISVVALGRGQDPNDRQAPQGKTFEHYMCNYLRFKLFYAEINKKESTKKIYNSL